MATGTSTDWSRSLGEIIITIRRFLEKISSIILQVLSSFQDVLEASLRVHSSAVREYPIPLRETVMDGMTRDASSDVLPLYLGPIIISKSSHSGNSKRPAGSIQRTSVYLANPESPLSQHAMSIILGQQIQRCRQSSTQYIARISLLTTQCEPGTMTSQ